MSDSARACTMQVTKALQQDKESYDSNTSHEEKVPSFFEDARELSLCSGLHDAGHKGVATGRCELSLCSLISAVKTVPLNEVSLYLNV
ncbi:hypothetical protein ACFQ4A_01780 [Lentibacillus salinarum]|uniref:Uncharacterized protein n=1 Tax=Lentibacillus salinarum TaxID=446820 RepID=A0ABW3ZPW8_9BACI